jgi:hypothetical protein
VTFAAISLCVASQRVFVFISLSTQSGNFWIHSRTRNNRTDLRNTVGKCGQDARGSG